MGGSGGLSAWEAGGGMMVACGFEFVGEHAGSPEPTWSPAWGRGQGGIQGQSAPGESEPVILQLSSKPAARSGSAKGSTTVVAW
jgi:hypothetical protein